MPFDATTQSRPVRYWSEEEIDALADAEAELSDDFAEAADLDFTGLERELFTSYDQHGFLDSEWSR